MQGVATFKSIPTLTKVQSYLVNSRLIWMQALSIPTNTKAH